MMTKVIPMLTTPTTDGEAQDGQRVVEAGERSPPVQTPTTHEHRQGDDEAEAAGSGLSSALARAEGWAPLPADVGTRCCSPDGTGAVTPPRWPLGDRVGSLIPHFLP
jgi:hypothetical protein